MADEYNSKLIDDFYSEWDQEKIIEILAEMQDIADLHFLFPIYGKYKLMSGSSISHYFISTIIALKSEDSKNILVNIASDSQTSEKNLTWTLDFLSDLGIFPEIIVSRVIVSLYSLDKTEQDYTARSILSFLKKAGALKNHADYLKQIFKDNSYPTNIRTLFLNTLLNLDPTAYFKEYFDNYADFKDTKAEVIFAKEIKKWKDGIIPQFKEKILKEGGKRAKDIIETHLKEKEKEKQETAKKEQEEQEQKFSNVSLVEEIVDLRQKINELAVSSQTLGVNIFAPSEHIFKQSVSAKSKAELISHAINLRSTIQQIEADACAHGLTFENAKSIIPTLTEEVFQHSLTGLQLFFHSKNVSVETTMVGIKKLNRILSLLAHPEKSEELIPLLKKFELEKQYTEERWSGLHHGLLLLYKNRLGEIYTALVQA